MRYQAQSEATLKASGGRDIDAITAKMSAVGQEWKYGDLLTEVPRVARSDMIECKRTHCP